VRLSRPPAALSPEPTAERRALLGLARVLLDTGGELPDNAFDGIPSPPLVICEVWPPHPRSLGSEGETAGFWVMWSPPMRAMIAAQKGVAVGPPGYRPSWPGLGGPPDHFPAPPCPPPFLCCRQAPCS